MCIRDRDIGVEYFQSSIDQFLKTLSFDVVAKKLVEDIGRLDNLSLIHIFRLSHDGCV